MLEFGCFYLVYVVAEFFVLWGWMVVFVLSCCLVDVVLLWLCFSVTFDWVGVVLLYTWLKLLWVFMMRIGV